ncbi:MAG: hypothetical protein ABWY05_16220 [Noviherbaspirillum sp.]
MKRNTPENKIVVITGGSSGIGYACADKLLDKAKAPPFALRER